MLRFHLLVVHNQRFLFDWDNTDPANSLVSSLYLLLFKTFDAKSSMSDPVCLLVPFCAKAEPASFLAVLDEFGSVKTFEALEATVLEVFLLFTVIPSPY